MLARSPGNQGWIRQLPEGARPSFVGRHADRCAKVRSWRSEIVAFSDSPQSSTICFSVGTKVEEAKILPQGRSSTHFWSQVRRWFCARTRVWSRMYSLHWDPFPPKVPLLQLKASLGGSSREKGPCPSLWSKPLLQQSDCVLNYLLVA